MARTMIRRLLARTFGAECVYPVAAARSIEGAMREQDDEEGTA